MIQEAQRASDSSTIQQVAATPAYMQCNVARPGDSELVLEKDTGGNPEMARNVLSAIYLFIYLWGGESQRADLQYPSPLARSTKAERRKGR